MIQSNETRHDSTVCSFGYLPVSLAVYAMDGERVRVWVAGTEQRACDVHFRACRNATVVVATVLVGATGIEALCGGLQAKVKPISSCGGRTKLGLITLINEINTSMGF